MVAFQDKIIIIIIEQKPGAYSEIGLGGGDRWMGLPSHVFKIWKINHKPTKFNSLFLFFSSFPISKFWDWGGKGHFSTEYAAEKHTTKAAIIYDLIESET